MDDVSAWIDTHPLATQVIVAALCLAVVALFVLHNRE